MAVSAVVAAPSGSAPGGGWPVVAWAHGTTGVASRCAPSLDDDAGVGRIPDLQRLLDGGAVVVATDYPGLGTPGPHPYLVGEREGRAVLDSVRAAQRLLGDEASQVTALFGHSQGGHAVVFATELAASYAPELDLVGAAPMAPPTALGELLERDQREPAGIVLTALAVTSWSELYADAREDAVVHPEARRFVASIGRRCIATTAESLADLPDVVALRLEFLSADPATAPGWSEHLRANSPTTVPDGVPVLVVQGLADDIVRPDVTEAFVRDRCAAGARIRLETYPGVDHFGIRTAAAGEVTGWLLERLEGVPRAGGLCDRESLTSYLGL